MQRGLCVRVAAPGMPSSSASARKRQGRSHDVFDIPVMQNDEVDLAVVAVSHMTCQPLTACHPQ